jgi:hypothetical protein
MFFLTSVKLLWIERALTVSHFSVTIIVVKMRAAQFPFLLCLFYIFLMLSSLCCQVISLKQPLNNQVLSF